MKLLRTVTILLVFPVAAVSTVMSQDTPAQALDNVTIHLADGSTIESGTIVWRNGVIESVGSNVSIPFDAFTIDGGDSLHVYPGFIDGMALWGSPDLPNRYERPDDPGNPGYERAGIQPQRQPGKLLKSDDKNLQEAQKSGFTTAALGLKGQMLPGQIDLFFLNGEKTGDDLYRGGLGLLSQLVPAPGGWGSGAYPSTTIGVMARFRQLMYDATALKQHKAYYASNSNNYPVPASDEVLEALFPVIDKTKPLFFVADTKENIERVFRLHDEFGFNMVLVSGKEAAAHSGLLRQKNIPVLASIELPEEPEWRAKEKKAAQDTAKTEEKTEEQEISEEMQDFREKQLQAYQESIQNIKRLIEAGVKVGYASNGLKLADLKKHLKVLLDEGGLTEPQVLGMFTRHTADILGAGSRMGDLRQGRIASFSVFTEPFTAEKTQVRYSVSNGKLTEFEAGSQSQGRNSRR